MSSWGFSSGTIYFPNIRDIAWLRTLQTNRRAVTFKEGRSMTKIYQILQSLVTSTEVHCPNLPSRRNSLFPCKECSQSPAPAPSGSSSVYEWRLYSATGKPANAWDERTPLGSVFACGLPLGWPPLLQVHVRIQITIWGSLAQACIFFYGSLSDLHWSLEAFSHYLLLSSFMIRMHWYTGRLS